MGINLSDENRKRIQAKLPVIDDRFLLGTQFGFSVGTYDTDNKTSLHISLVCQDPKH